MAEIAITRVYDAPREQVWKAWTDPDRLAQWWGKRGWIAQRETIVMDLRPGGSFHVTTINEDDGAEMTSEGTYGEIREPELLVIGDATVTFSDLGDGRTQMDFHTTMDADAALLSRARGGLGSAFDRLGEQLTTPTHEEHPA